MIGTGCSLSTGETETGRPLRSRSVLVLQQNQGEGERISRGICLKRLYEIEEERPCMYIKCTFLGPALRVPGESTF